MTESTIRWEKGADNIVILTLDDPQQSANTMNDRYTKSMHDTVERLEKEKADIAGVIVTSAKKTFFAGGDLRDLIKVKPENAQEMADGGKLLKGDLRKLETLGIPVVCALNGTALGGGLEIALSCHRRIALNNPKAQFGLPEVSLGLLPGAGGIVRTVRMLGIQNALMNVLMQGQRMKVDKALKVGIIDEVVDSEEEMIAKAKEFILANPKSQQPWDEKGYKIPGGTPSVPKFAANLPAFPANLRKQLKGANYPAPKNIMAAAVESAQVDVDNAFKIEERYFIDLVTGQVAKNMINAFFFNLQAINGGASRPKDVPKFTAKKVGVLGAGMMGAGIAYVTAMTGSEVVLKDISVENAEKGKDYSRKLLDKAISRGKMTEEKKEQVLSLITATADAKDLEGVDFVIEAVFESTELKHKVFQEIEDVVLPDAVLGSNTSSLPITGLAKGVKKQDNFIGIHFFSPVDKMNLVEIIKGQGTGDVAVAKALDFVRQIRKTPIVVNDARFFYANRCIIPYINEGIRMVKEGVEPALIENAAKLVGMPLGPLQLTDETSIDLGVKIAKATKAAMGEAYDDAQDEVLFWMADEGRLGKKANAGFYSYDDNGKRGLLWEGLSEKFPVREDQPDLSTVQHRLLFAQVLEAVRAFEDGVLMDIREGDVAAILGWGFAPWSGGPFSWLDILGAAYAAEQCDSLTAAFGPRFACPALLRDLAETGESFYERYGDGRALAQAA